MTSTQPALTHHPAPTSTPVGPHVWRALLAGVLPPVLVWTALVPVGGLDLLVDQLGEPARVELPAVVLAGVMAALGAVATARRIRTRTGRPRRVFTMVAGAVLLLSLVGPFVTAQSNEATIGLLLLHLAVGLTVIPVVAAGLEPGQPRG